MLKLEWDGEYFPNMGLMFCSTLLPVATMFLGSINEPPILFHSPLLIGCKSDMCMNFWKTHLIDELKFVFTKRGVFDM